MSRSAWSLLRSLTRRLPADGEPLADAELLRRFAADRDQAAFEVLVWRHGGMALGVCRRLLRDEHAAEDAFQATFLILARKAGSVRGNAAGWLHRVARRVAIRASKGAKYERLAADPPDRPTTSSDPELAALLDAEIDRLPDRFRLPVVLCYLDGRRTEDAAELLGVPRGTVLSRLATARQTLAARLTRRGVTLPVGGLAATVTAEHVTASVSAAGRFVAGGLTGGTVQLANEVLHMGVRKQVIGWAAMLVATAGLGTGVMVGAGERPNAAPEPAPEVAARIQKPAAEKPQADPSSAKNLPAVQDREDIEQQKKAARRMADEVERRLRSSQAQLADLNHRSVQEVGLPALQAAISQLDSKIMDARDERSRLPETTANESAVKEADQRIQLRIDRLELQRTRLAFQTVNRQKIDHQISLIEDELAVYRDLRRSLLRRQMQLDFGLDPTAALDGNTIGSDRLDQITRQLATLRSTLQTSDGKSRIDAIQQGLDELRSEMKRLADQRK
ncbi:MAG: sigma-70 family RNA polymerase sigma factor [Gemmataceae bacterium]